MRLRFYRKIAQDENSGNDKTSALLRFDRYLREEERVRKRGYKTRRGEK